jgi:hypothetical protein
LNNPTAARALTGLPLPIQVKWRMNLVTRYTFREGFLKRLRVSANMCWQDRKAIGFPLLTNEGGIKYNDLTNPYWGPDNLRIGMSLTCNKKRLRLFGPKVDWTITLRLNNLYQTDELIPVRANSDGTIGTCRLPPDRGWSISNSFSF